MKIDDEFYKPSEIAKLLKLSRMTIWRYIKTGKLKAFKIERFLRVSKKDLEEFLNKRK